jgi:twitching motility protein PilI
MSQLDSNQSPGSGPIAEASSRGTRLREFQAQLVERMQAARSGAMVQASMLGLRVGETHWLLDLPEAGEIVPFAGVTRVPLTKPWYLGLGNIRGNLVGIIDFAQFLGMAPTPIDKESRIVSFSTTLTFNCGLLVSRVMGLRKLADMERQESDDDASPWKGHRYVDRDAQAWTEIRLSEIVKDPQFLHVGL